MVNGKYFSDSLEDKVRDFDKNGDLLGPGETKVYGETAIPYGEYEVVVTMSPKFKRLLPLLLNVKHFTGIRIHRANKPTELEGCIALGENKIKGMVVNSAPYEKKLVRLLLEAQAKKEKITIKIT